MVNVILIIVIVCLVSLLITLGALKVSNQEDDRNGEE